MSGVISPYPPLGTLPANAILLHGYSDAGMAKAMAALGSNPGTIVAALPGTGQFSGSYQFGPGQGLISMAGPGAVIFNYTGNGVFITSHDPAFNTSNTTPLQSIAGPQTGYIIDGTGAGPNAVGIRIGDQNLPNVNIGVRNFTGANAIGAWLCNQVGWTNYGSIIISTDNCTNHVQFDNAGGTASFGSVNYEFTQTAQPNQNGIIAKNGCQAVGGTFQLYGGYLGALATNSGTVLSIGPDNTGAGFRNFSSFNVGVEADSGAGTVSAVTVALGSSGFFMQNTGQLFFRNQGGTFQASTGLFPYRFTFNGWIESATADGALCNPSVNGVGMVTKGSSLWWAGVTDATHIYNGTGDLFHLTLANGANTVAVANPVAGMFQRMRLEVAQPASGAAGTLTITGAKTPAGGGAVTLSATNGAIDVVEIWYDDAGVLFASALALNYH